MCGNQFKSYQLIITEPNVYHFYMHFSIYSTVDLLILHLQYFMFLQIKFFISLTDFHKILNLYVLLK